jgi:CspA family cold shock protein
MDKGYSLLFEPKDQGLGGQYGSVTYGRLRCGLSAAEIRAKECLDVANQNAYCRLRSEADCSSNTSDTVRASLPLSLLYSRTDGLGLRRTRMAKGKVKWWDNKKGLGFIAQDGGQDVFVHHTAIMGKGFKILREGEEVIFEVVAGEKGPKAENVQRAEPS